MRIISNREYARLHTRQDPRMGHPPAGTSPYSHPQPVYLVQPKQQWHPVIYVLRVVLALAIGWFMVTLFGNVLTDSFQQVNSGPYPAWMHGKLDPNYHGPLDPRKLPHWHDSTQQDSAPGMQPDDNDPAHDSILKQLNRH